jgi:signal recognition particle receptor subunit beta
LVLKGVDGIVFVADSLEARRTSNAESFQNLENNLKEQGKSVNGVPLVMQYNKRDLDGSKVVVMPVEAMEGDLNAYKRYPSFAASALRGDGVRETFKKICVMTVVDVSSRLLKDKGMGLG